MNQNEFRRKQEILEAYRRRLHERELQSAKFGINADPAIKIEIDDINTEMRRIEREIIGNLSSSAGEEEDILVLHTDIINQFLPKSSSYRSLPSSAADVTEYIKVFVKSNRFGRRLQFQIPQDITAGAFIDLVVNSLGLPWSQSVDELMISFTFRYSVVFKGETISLNKTFRNSGIEDGGEVQLSIRSVWTDKIEKAEIEEAKSQVMWHTASRMLGLTKREEARKERGVLTKNKIKSLADGCFSFVDDIGLR
jgi:hypothetical protein